MKSKEKISADDHFFEILTFLATSARGCIDEPHLYGSLRLIDALSKLLDLPKYAPCLSQSALFDKIKKEIEEKRFLVVSEVQEFKEFIDKIVQELAKEAKRRSTGKT